MLPYSWYLLKVIICSGILFGYYWLFLRNKIFHRYNRFYLVSAILLSLLLPLAKIDFWQPDRPQSQVIKVLQAVSAGDEYMNNVVLAANTNNWNMQELYSFIYGLISVFFLLVLLRTLLIIRSLLKKYTVQMVEQVSFVNTDDNSTPFSFLKYIFWNSGIDLDSTTGRQIFKHELAHIREKHTYDKLLVNILLVFCWCNPFFWLYRKELNMIHEFIADQRAVEDSDTTAFATMILQAAYPKHRFELTNNFFYSPIKRRLLMLKKNNDPRVNYFARIMALPLLAVVFAAFAFKPKKTDDKQYDFPSYVITDTVPLKSNLLPSDPAIVPSGNASVMEEKADPEKALLVVNGNMIGKGKAKDGLLNQLYAQTITVKWLKRSEAIAKYGADGADGACEISYTDGVTISTFIDALDNSSVFYMGMRNPLTVTAQNVQPEDLVVSISEGKIFGINGEYMVTVTHEGEVTLTLSKRDGTKLPGPYTVKVKRLPDPTDPAFPSALREKVRYDSSLSAKMNQELLDQQQGLAKPGYAEKELNAKITDVAVEKTLYEKKLKELETQNLKLKLIEEQKLKTNTDLTERVVMGKKMQDSEIQNLKLKRIQEQQIKNKQEFEEQLVLSKDKADAYQKQLAEVEVQGKPGNVIFVKTEQIPSFPGGVEAWKKYLVQHVRSTTPVDEGWKAGKYTVVVRFIVHADGKVSDVTTENYKGTLTAMHCIEIIRNGPRWLPAIQNGKKVNAYHKQPITFVIADK